jgi:hypothetical protein
MLKWEVEDPGAWIKDPNERPFRVTQETDMGDVMRHVIHWRVVLIYSPTQEFLLRKSSPGKRQREEEKPEQQGGDSARQKLCRGSRSQYVSTTSKGAYEDFSARARRCQAMAGRQPNQNSGFVYIDY